MYCECKEYIMCNVHKSRHDYQMYLKENNLYPYSIRKDNK